MAESQLQHAKVRETPIRPFFATDQKMEVLLRRPFPQSRHQAQRPLNYGGSRTYTHTWEEEGTPLRTYLFPESCRDEGERREHEMDKPERAKERDRRTSRHGIG